MRLRHFILIGSVGLILVSCRLTGDSESTPYFNMQVLHIVGEDTTVLNLSGNTLDTISVGDTITFQTILYSQYNRLLRYQITSSREKSVEFIWSDKDSLDNIFTSASDYDKGLFVMDGTFSQLYFPFKYVAKEEEKDLKLSFMVVNNAGQEYSTSSRTIVTPIKEATKQEEKEESTTNKSILFNS